MRVSHEGRNGVASYPACSFINQSSKGHVIAEQKILVFSLTFFSKASSRFDGIGVGFVPLILYRPDESLAVLIHGAHAHEDLFRRFHRDRGGGETTVLLGHRAEHELNVHSAQDVDTPVAGDQEIHPASDRNSVNYGIGFVVGHVHFPL